jgi:hypothetical protein
MLKGTSVAIRIVIAGLLASLMMAFYVCYVLADDRTTVVGFACLALRSAQQCVCGEKDS